MTDMADRWMHYLNYHSVWLIFSAAAIFVIVWGLSEYFLHKNQKAYRTINLILLIVAVGVVLRCTILGRKTADYSVSLIPFATLHRAFGDKVLFKSLLFNILLFMPLSLFGCSAFSCIQRKRAWFLIAAGTAFSIIIEALQYVFSIGMVDSDDVICNMLGLIIGTLLYRLHYRLFFKARHDGSL